MENDLENLSRREKRKILREQDSGKQQRDQATRRLGKLFIGLLVIGLLIAGGWWLWREINKPLPGQKVEDMGQNHVTDISNITYNSDPPTSGPHFPVWAKRGMYDRVISDGHLVHSLEHGYVILSYNCERKFSIFNFQFSIAHAEEATPSLKPLTKMAVGVSGRMSFFTPQNPPSIEVELPELFKSDECKKLVGDLWDIGDDFQRVIIVPRPTLDVPIALTAWGRIEKLENFDREKIKAFISAYQNRGPEKTNE